MNFNAKKIFSIFEEAISTYHIKNDVNFISPNPYTKGSLEAILFEKCMIDTIQWHLEDHIRSPKIAPKKALEIKRSIDISNQKRTDIVEEIDMLFYKHFKNVEVKKDAYTNTETLGWAIDRFSILALKIYHMKEESERIDASKNHRNTCQKKLNRLLIQKKDLLSSIEQLYENIKNGKARITFYLQMKMYNDKTLNPVLYKSENKPNAHSSL